MTTEHHRRKQNRWPIKFVLAYTRLSIIHLPSTKQNSKIDLDCFRKQHLINLYRPSWIMSSDFRYLYQPHSSSFIVTPSLGLGPKSSTWTPNLCASLFSTPKGLDISSKVFPWVSTMAYGTNQCDTTYTSINYIWAPTNGFANRRWSLSNDITSSPETHSR